jgi:NAD(P) transhydrogenase
MRAVALIEKDAPLGGACVNTSTLPSKTLKDTIYQLHGFTLRSFETIASSLRQHLSFRDLLARKDLVIDHEREVVANQLRRNGVEIVQGTTRRSGKMAPRLSSSTAIRSPSQLPEAQPSR